MIVALRKWCLNMSDESAGKVIRSIYMTVATYYWPGATPDTFNADQWIENAQNLGCNTIHTFVKTVTGISFHKTKLGPMDEAWEKSGRDPIRELLQAAKSRGVDVYGLVRTTEDGYYVKTHPEARPVAFHGAPIEGNYNCLNNSGYRQHRAKQAGELAAMYPELAAVEIDHPFLTAGVPNFGCYCETCRRLWAEKHPGVEPPKKPGEPYWLDWVTFRYYAGSGIVEAFAKGARAANPKMKVATTTTGWGDRASIFYNIYNEGIAKHVDVLEVSAWYRQPTETITTFRRILEEQTRRNLRLAKDKTMLVRLALLGDNTAEVEPCLNAPVKNGANGTIIWHHVDVDKMGEAYKKEIRRVHLKKVARRTLSSAANLFSRSELDNEVFEIWLADPTAAQLPSPRGRIYNSGHEGLNMALSDVGVETQVIWNEDVNAETLKSFKVLLIPNVSVMTDERVKTIKTWVSSGGTLIATYDASSRTIADRRSGYSRLPDFALNDVYGCHLKSLEKRKQITVTQVSPLTQGFKIGDNIDVAGVRTAVVEAKPGSSVVAEFEDKKPAVILNAFGAGKSVYFAADIGNVYVETFAHLIRHRDTGIRQLLLDAVRMAGD